MTYLDYLLDPETKGIYICQLEATGGERKHVLGVDCDGKQRAIYDPSERYAIKLNRRNFDYCCGKYLIGLQKIYLCYQIVRNF